MVITKNISLQTKGECDIVDITSQVQQQLSETGIKDGTVTVFITGSTAGVTTIENEPGLIVDFKAMWERVIPKNIEYRHDRAWGEGNGYSHVRASLLGASLVVPFHNKRLALGTWQQIVVVDFDNRPRSRQVLLQVMGE
ncbi:MAG TPA: secondary thiamine-phosphate synthase enzyme YjbQ [Dehalococcoidales bacterium]|nr:secondary thiamine-phosphate synthase enzyme YjbQ [Dehalococcoidales bacterium]